MGELMILIDNHPLACIRIFRSFFPASLGSVEDLSGIRKYFISPSEQLPIYPNPELKGIIRDLLRHGGFKPSGRSKPASEYLLKALEKEWFSPEKGINAAVDCCNVISLHSGLPVSVIDEDKASPPWRISICPDETRYPFNPSGQVINASGLLALCDSQGPSATPVKDSQRTKTHDGTTQTLSVIWGSTECESQVERALEWYRQLLNNLGIQTELVATEMRAPDQT